MILNVVMQCLGWLRLLRTLHCSMYWPLYWSLMILGPEWRDKIPILHLHVHVSNTLVIRATKYQHIHTSWYWDLVEPSWVAWAWTWLSADWDDTISRATYSKINGCVARMCWCLWSNHKSSLNTSPHKLNSSSPIPTTVKCAASSEAW